MKDRYMSLTEVSEYTQIPSKSLREKCNPNMTPRDRLLPCYKPGKELRFKLSEVEQWMKRHKVA